MQYKLFEETFKSVIWDLIKRKEIDMAIIKEKYRVSVLLVTYNSDWEKTKLTLNSIVMQKNISFEIVVSDDGSKNNNYELIKSFFEDIDFKEYVFVHNENNVGTIKNILRTLNVASGQYIKVISPGDTLLGENLLYDWCNFLDNSGKKWTFGNVLNTKNCLGRPIELLAKMQMPKNVKAYLVGDELTARYECVIKLNKPHGTSALLDRKLFEKYLIELSGNIKYAEDFVFVLLMLDEHVPAYYPKNVVLYECNAGFGSKNYEIMVSETERVREYIGNKRKYLELLNIAENYSIDERLKEEHFRISGLGLNENELTKDAYICCLKRQLNEIINRTSNKQVWIYGAGRWGRIIADFLSEKEIKIKGYIDSNYMNIQCLDGLPVVGIDSVHSEGVFVIVSLIEHRTFESFLNEKGFLPENYMFINVTNFL